MQSKICRKKHARSVTGLLAGEKNGKKFGMKLRTVQKNAGDIKVAFDIFCMFYKNSYWGHSIQSIMRKNHYFCEKY